MKKTQTGQKEGDSDSSIGWRRVIVGIGGIASAVIALLIGNSIWEVVKPNLFPSSTPTSIATVTQPIVAVTAIPSDSPAASTPTAMATANQPIPSATIMLSVSPTPATPTNIPPTPTPLPTIAQQPSETPPLSPTIEPSTTLSPTPIPSTATELPTPDQNACLAKIKTDNGNAVQIRTSPEGPVSGVVYADTNVVVADKSEESTGKWYLILDESGTALGWLEEGNIGSLSTSCPKR